MAFQKGQSGNPTGMRRGTRQKKTKEIEQIAKALVQDKAYKKSLERRLEEGTAPHMETLLHHYAYGKPKERVEVTGPEGQPLIVQFYLPSKSELPS